MPTTSNIAWKLSTFAALALAVGFAVRPLRGPAAASASGSATERVSANDARNGARSPGFYFGAGAEMAVAGGSRDAKALERLKSARSPAAACEAIAELGYSSEPAAVAAIVDATGKQRRAEVRQCAVTALGKMPGGAARSWLEELILDRDPLVRVAALGGLAAKDDPEARAIVFKAARGDDPELRVAAAVALGTAHVAEATPLLIDAVMTSTGTTQRTLIEALGATEDPAALPALMAIARDGARTSRYAALAALASIGGPEAIAVLEDALTHGDPHDVEVAAEALAQMPDEAAHRVLLVAASGARRASANAALMHLRAVEGDDVRAVMIARLGMSDPEALTSAVDYFAEQHDVTAVPRLLEIASRGGANTSRQAVVALGALGGLEARMALAEIARTPGKGRETALSQLAELPGGPAEVRALCLRMKDEGGADAQVAVRMLGQDESAEARDALLDMARAGGPHAAQAVSALGGRRDADSLRALTDLAERGASSDLRVEALRALGQSNDSRAVPALTRALSSSDPGARIAALDALGPIEGGDAERAILDSASRGDTALRAAAAQALAGRGTPASTARLEEMTKDGERQVAQTAYNALVSDAPERAQRVASDALRSTDVSQRRDAVGMVSLLEPEESRPLLLEALRDRDESVVLRAARQLGNVGGSDVQTALYDVMLRSSSSASLKKATAMALERMGGALARTQADVIAKYGNMDLPAQGGAEGESDTMAASAGDEDDTH